MTPAKVVLLSVILSIVASAVVALLLIRDDDRTPRAAGGGPAAQTPQPILAPAAPPDPALEDRLRRIEARLDAQGAPGTPRPKEEALQALLAIKEGTRQLAIRDSFRELVALGNDIVPEIVALLRSGRGQDWGGAFSLSGNVVGGYPRLRTLLIDVLRQIGTPEAHQGLLDGLRGTEDMTDYRDIFMLFRTTADPTMVNGMNAMLAGAVRGLKGEDPKKAFLVADGVAYWIQNHEFEGRLDLIEEVASQGLERGWMDRGSFGLLVGLAPERAVDVTRLVRERQGERGLRGAAAAMGAGEETPRAQIARYLELLFASGLAESERLGFYARVPTTPCASIRQPSERDADARALVDFLKRRLVEETGESAKSVLTDHIARLEAALRQ